MNITKKQPGFFDTQNRFDKLDSQGDPLTKLNRFIDWNRFRPTLLSFLGKDEPQKTGRPGYDSMLLFKMLILQRLYNLSDDQLEFQVLDRGTFMRFLGLQLHDSVPDSKTIWHFREKLTNSGGIIVLFEEFSLRLIELGIICNEGKIVDATFVEVPKQRNTRAENETIKAGNTPVEWKKNPHKLAQKDLDARWTKKNEQTFYGYKAHTKVDAKSKTVRNFLVTDASVHDSQVFDGLIDEKEDKGQEIYADSAYASAATTQMLEEKGVMSKVMEKGTRTAELTKEQKESNKAKSSIRVRVEHVYGHMETSMNHGKIRCIGISRAFAMVGLTLLTYNMSRVAYLAGSQGISTPI